MKASLRLLVLLCLGLPAAHDQPALSPDFDAYVEQVRAAFEVPGLAVAVVRDGQVVLAKGYGVRTLGRPDPVDAGTRFGIASNTKAFTATALALLVEEGRLEWDAPVIRYLPWFRLSDPYVTAEITVRDLLVHRSGLSLGAGDLLWWPASTYDRHEIARRLRYLPLATSFRSHYAYDNVLYLVAGEVIEAVTGQSWEDFVTTRILRRIGMTGSTVRHSDAEAAGNVATTHARVDGVVRPIAPFTSDNTNPAGGINAGAADMARWLVVQLDSGRVAPGDRLFSPQTTRELWSIVTPIPVGDPPPELAPLRTAFSGYGLGFRLLEYRGHKLVTHTGGLPGYVSRVAMIPDRKIGVAVLTNQESGAAFNAIAYHVLDALLGVPPYDWLGAYQTLQARRQAALAAGKRAARSARDSTAGLSLPPSAYAGTYTDPWYGAVVVTEADGALTIRFAHTPALTGPLVHWQYDTFVARWTDRELRADAFVTFDLNPDGSIHRVRMQPFSPDVDFSFDFQDLNLTPARQ